MGSRLLRQRVIFSSITIASSTTNPTEIVSAIKEIVETIVHEPHQCAGAEQRERHSDARNNRRPWAAQKGKDDHYYKHDGKEQRELHIRTEARIVCVRSLIVKILIAGGMAAFNRGSSAKTWSTVVMTLAPGCL
jgi:hypothetical protein